MAPSTLIEGFTFLVTTAPGTLGATGGLFHRDVRYLSALDVRVPGVDVVPMGETIAAANKRRLTLSTGVPAVNEISEQTAPKHTDLVIERVQSVHEQTGHRETIRVHNHTASRRTVTLAVDFDVDFADLFEVRGLRSDIDRRVNADVRDDSVAFSYEYPTAAGEDVERRSTVRFAPRPAKIDATSARFALDVDSQETTTVEVAVALDESELGPATGHDASEITRPPPADIPPLTLGDARYSGVFERAAADLVALTTETAYGPVPLAGTPWFATPFGRDAMLTAHQTVAVAPELATGTLRYFAAHRGQTVDSETEEEPGKMFHEIRHGELADRHRVPHTPYYGTIDATALWVMLLARTYRWTRDDDLLEELASPLVDALEWVRRASASGADDPFVYYETDEGVLEHKAWKDTPASIRFADGEVASGPLAVAEVQGYAAAALDRGATLLDELDADREGAADPDRYRARARRIEAAFDEEFWLPDRSFYALAKDDSGRLVDAVTSNVGHCLWTETIPAHRVPAVVEKLVGGPLDSGWGVRTMSPADAGYSPVSYHAGGVWPHDTSITALGLARTGHPAAAEKLARDVLDAATQFDHARLPELYCGFDDERDPVSYPAACTPQAWAAGAPFAFLRAAFCPQPTDGGVEITRSPSLFADEAAEILRRRWTDTRI